MPDDDVEHELAAKEAHEWAFENAYTASRVELAERAFMAGYSRCLDEDRRRD